jgi:hypothetical protein
MIGGLRATIAAPDRRRQDPLDQCSTTLDRRYTAARERRAMSNRALAAGGIRSLAPIGAAVAETVDRGFDWGSAAVGAGVGAAVTLLLLALGAVVRSRGTGSHHGGGRST